MRPKGKEYSGFFIQLSQSDSAGCETLSDVIRMSFQIEGGGRLAPWAKKAEDEANNLFQSFRILLSHSTLTALASGYFFAGFSNCFMCLYRHAHQQSPMYRHQVLQIPKAPCTLRRCGEPNQAKMQLFNIL